MSFFSAWLAHGRTIPSATRFLRPSASAVHHGYVMVTENLDHFERIPGIEIENWVER